MVFWVVDVGVGGQEVKMLAVGCGGGSGGGCGGGSGGGGGGGGGVALVELS